jgi:hypothetical protein
MENQQLLNLARQIIALLEPKAKSSVKSSKPNTQPRKTKAKATGTFEALPKNKQAYITKKQKEYRKIFQRDHSTIPKREVTKYITIATKESIALARSTPHKLSLEQWKEGVDEAFENLVLDESDDESDDDDEESESDYENPQRF